MYYNSNSPATVFTSLWKSCVAASAAFQTPSFIFVYASSTEPSLLFLTNFAFLWFRLKRTSLFRYSVLYTFLLFSLLIKARFKLRPGSGGVLELHAARSFKGGLPRLTVQLDQLSPPWLLSLSLPRLLLQWSQPWSRPQSS